MMKLAGEQNVIWASDFPHSDAKYPGVVEELREHTGELSQAERAALYGGNALRLYGIEPSAAVRARQAASAFARDRAQISSPRMPAARTP